MRTVEMHLMGLALGSLILVSSCTHRQTPVQQDIGSLVAISRAYGQGGQISRSGSLKLVGDSQTPVPQVTGDTEEQYENQIAADLIERDYDALERAAREARVSKSRFKGGTWRLYIFYEALGHPTLGAQATEEDWKFHITGLKDWGSARPESVTARLALAETYENYADHARGSGYANTVSEEGWRLDRERIAMAASTLTEVAKLKEKCPYWYELMQRVALAQGWDKAQARSLLDAAMAFEPTYYHFYREYANFLLPKWYGAPGETEAFAEEISNQLGGQQGKFVYFEIASLVTCQCDSDDSHMEYLSWPKIKEGYAVLGELYGFSNLKMNRFAHMAVE
ncbi:MAG: hypothetical protein WB780_08585, partial [Candidatus Acidiferrales bacterium]